MAVALRKCKPFQMHNRPQAGVSLAPEKLSPRKQIGVLAMKTGRSFLIDVPRHGRVWRHVVRNGSSRVGASTRRVGLFDRDGSALRSFVARNGGVRLLVFGCHEPSVPDRPANYNADLVKLAPAC